LLTAKETEVLYDCNNLLLSSFHACVQNKFALALVLYTEIMLLFCPIRSKTKTAGLAGTCFSTLETSYYHLLWDLRDAM